jgi:hypothetical protein
VEMKAALHPRAENLQKTFQTMRAAPDRRSPLAASHSNENAQVAWLRAPREQPQLTGNQQVLVLPYAPFGSGRLRNGSGSGGVRHTCRRHWPRYSCRSTSTCAFPTTVSSVALRLGSCSGGVCHARPQPRAPNQVVNDKYLYFPTWHSARVGFGMGRARAGSVTHARGQGRPSSWRSTSTCMFPTAFGLGRLRRGSGSGGVGRTCPRPRAPSQLAIDKYL